MTASMVLFILACAVLAFCGIVGVLELVWRFHLDEPPEFERTRDALARASRPPRSLP